MLLVQELGEGLSDWTVLQPFRIALDTLCGATVPRQKNGKEWNGRVHLYFAFADYAEAAQKKIKSYKSFFLTFFPYLKCEIFDPMYVETQKLAPCYTEAKGWPVQYQGPGVTICLVENGWECSCDKLLKITLAARQAVKAAAAVAWAAVAVAVVAATTTTTTTTKQVS